MAIDLTSGDLLTEEQLNSHFAVYAGPGSGKTHFLVNNIKNIVTTHPVIINSNERKVLCITYTNAAVDEIQRRLDRYIMLHAVVHVNRCIYIFLMIRS